ncbi:MAG: ABC transporter permease [Armatimonadota bacterium]
MHVPYFMWIAWRYVGARLRQTMLTTAGVALGVTIVTIMQSYIGGILNMFTQRALQSTPHVTVTQVQQGLPNPAGPVRLALKALNNPVIEVAQLPIPNEEEELENPRVAEQAIAAIPGVVAIAPFVTGQGVALNGDLREPVSFIGIRPLDEIRITDFSSRLVAGSANELAQHANGIILGAILTSRLSARPGDRITLISQEGISRRFLVVGTYSAEIRDIDLTRAYLNLPQAQQLMGTRGVSGLSVRTASLDMAGDMARRIQVQTGYKAQSWRELNSNILGLFTTISMIIYLVVGLTMVVAGFGIANTLVLTVSEKRRDIGVLKAMGMPAVQIALLFLVIGVIVGVIGVTIGEILGYLGISTLARTRIPIPQEGNQLISSQYFPVLQIPRVYILSGAFGLLVSIFASIIPSLRAAKSDPLEVIRGAE